ncbi:MAG: DUF6802 family protein [Antricoccus sp.]
MSDDISPSEFGLSETPNEGGSSMTAEQLESEIFGNDNNAADESAVADIFPSDSNSDSDVSDPAVTEHISADFSGTQFDAGVATYDSNGDGVADTAVQDHGYQVEYYIDTDGDGKAYELTITDGQGDLISHTQLVAGTEATWQETPAPNVAAGDMSVSPNVGPSGYVQPESAEPAPATESAAQPPGAENAASVVASADAAATTVIVEPAPEADTGPAGDTSPVEPSPEAANSVTEGDLALTIDGQTYDLGAPSVDITGDGVADTVVVEQDGNVEYYVDTDGDGVADQIIVLDESNGDLINHEVYDPQTGTWTNVTDQDKQ